MIGEGARVQFIPSYSYNVKLTPAENWKQAVIGKITLVNWKNRVFIVEYPCGNTRQREAFQFMDIGKAVKILGR